MNTMWTRRTLLQAGSLSLAGSVLRPFAFGAPLHPQGKGAPQKPQYFLYTTVHAGSGALEGIHVSVTGHDAALGVQVVRSAAPAALAISADKAMLFVANCIGTYGHRPTGSVESYAIDAKNGQLHLVSRQGLSLAATYPTSLAVSPDRSLLAVVAAEGSLLTLLHIRSDGELGEAFAVRKEMQSLSSPSQAARRSHAHVCFAPDGHLQVADTARRSVSILACEPDGMRLLDRRSMAERGTTVAFLEREGYLATGMCEVTPSENTVLSGTAAALANTPVLARIKRAQPEAKLEEALTLFGSVAGHGSYSLARQGTGMPASVAWIPVPA